MLAAFWQPLFTQVLTHLYVLLCAEDKRNKKKKKSDAAEAAQEQQQGEVFVGLFKDAAATQ